MIRNVLALMCLALLLGGCGKVDAGEPPTLMVAAAADLYFAFTEIGQRFQEETGVSVTFVFGSSGQLAQQIENGAPFDLFAAANETYIDRLAARGLIVPDSRQLYAQGRIVIVVNRRSGRTVERLEDLADLTLGPIAIANPDHAPYGLAARQALERMGLWEQVQPRIVMGENVRQALQFVQTGDAPVGIVALSVADVPEVRYTLVPPELHEPINQALAILKSSPRPNVARRFIEFVNGPVGRPIMRRYGFLLPGEF